MPYDGERMCVIDRVRGIVQDTHSTNLLLEDSEYEEILKTKSTRDFLQIYNDLSLTNAASATFKINTYTNSVMTLTIKNSGGTAINTQTLDLKGDDRVDSIRELVDYVDDLKIGWFFELYNLDVVRDLQSRPITSIGLEIGNQRIAKKLNKRSWDLEDRPTEVDVSGTSNKRRVAIYNPVIAAREALIRIQQDPRRLSKYREGAVELNRQDLTWRIKQLGRKDPIPAS